MTAISPYLRNGAFDPNHIEMMSSVLEQVCEALKINGDATAREVVAIRIIELTQRGENDAVKIRDRLLAEANGGSGC
jgi:hypothetical protein